MIIFRITWLTNTGIIDHWINSNNVEVDDDDDINPTLFEFEHFTSLLYLVIIVNLSSIWLLMFEIILTYIKYETQ